MAWQHPSTLKTSTGLSTWPTISGPALSGQSLLFVFCRVLFFYCNFFILAINLNVSGTTFDLSHVFLGLELFMSKVSLFNLVSTLSLFYLDSDTQTHLFVLFICFFIYSRVRLLQFFVLVIFIWITIISGKTLHVLQPQFSCPGCLCCLMTTTFLVDLPPARNYAFHCSILECCVIYLFHFTAFREYGSYNISL